MTTTFTLSLIWPWPINWQNYLNFVIQAPPNKGQSDSYWKRRRLVRVHVICMRDYQRQIHLTRGVAVLKVVNIVQWSHVLLKKIGYWQSPLFGMYIFSSEWQMRKLTQEVGEGEVGEGREGKRLPPIFGQKNLAFRDNASAYIVVLIPPMMML